MVILEAIPQSVGKYRVLGQIGRGSMGVVYKALDPEIERIVAIKMLRGVFQRSDQSEQNYYGSLRDEARSAGNLRHPNIITVFEVNTDSSSPYIVMDYLDGKGLDLLIKSAGLLSPELCIYYLAQAALGLDYAHDRGIIHCDVKPSNLLVEDGTQQLYILDFGIAKFASGPTILDSPVVGTPAYMSPEQIMNEKLDGQTDVFSLGIVAFELINGCRPFSGSDLTAVMGNIMRGSRVSMMDTAPHIAERCEPVFSTVFAQSRNERYVHCCDFISDLAKALYLEDPFKFVGNLPRIERPQAINDNFGKGRIRVGVNLDSIRDKRNVLSYKLFFRDNILSPISARLLALLLTTLLTLSLCVLYVVLRQKLQKFRISAPTATTATEYITGNPERFKIEYELFIDKSAPNLIEYLRSEKNDDEHIILALSRLRERGVSEVSQVALSYISFGSRAVRKEAFRCLASITSAQASNALRKGIYDWSPEVRSQVVDLIGQYHYYELIPDLSLAWYSEMSSEVKTEIQQTLEKLHRDKSESQKAAAAEEEGDLNNP